ncbi:MAG: DUF3459 domain-containing protein, partial [Nitrospira sp.]|nr:DUF3459 domain-containing protein [Nitrospira sp.]
ILKEMAAAVHAEAGKLNRRIMVIAESDLNDSRLIGLPGAGGYGLDGQWNDDFHHALRVVLTGEEKGYYQDFHGINDLVSAIQDGFVYHGQHSVHRRRRHGNSSRQCRPSQFVVFSQNHDQVGNRAVGDRLSTQLSTDAIKVMRALVLLAPNIPLLFMGEEYGETAPFQYFIEHGDPALIEAVRKGRQREFAHFGWNAEDIPDPQGEATFERSRLNWDGRDDRQEQLLHWTKELIRLRKTVPTLGAGDAEGLHHTVLGVEQEHVVVLHRWSDKGDGSLIILGFNREPVSLVLTEPPGQWRRRLDAGSAKFGGCEEGALPEELAIDTHGFSLTIPPFAAAVFAAGESSRPE